MQIGAKCIVFIAAIGYTIISLFYVVLFWSGQNPSIVVLIGFFALQFFAVGLFFGNLRALAMEPLSHIAAIGSFVETSVLPLFIGFTVFGLLSVLVFLRLKVITSRTLPSQ